MKTVYISLCMILFLCFSNLQTQNILAKKQNAVRIETSDEVANLSITINGSELMSGMYIYTLIADDKEIDTERMILTQ